MKFINQLKLGKVFFCCCLLFSTHSIHATVISLETSAPSVSIGDNVVIELWLRELGSEPLASFELDITFDENLLQFNQFTFGSFLGDGIDSFQDIFTASNSFNIAEWSLLDISDLGNLQSDMSGPIDFMLGSLNFAAITEGSASFDLSFDAMQGGLFAANGDNIDFTFAQPQLQIDIQPNSINQVPEPSTLGLFISMLCVVFASRSQGRSQAWRRTK